MALLIAVGEGAAAHLGKATPRFGCARAV